MTKIQFVKNKKMTYRQSVNKIACNQITCFNTGFICRNNNPFGKSTASFRKNEPTAKLTQAAKNLDFEFLPFSVAAQHIGRIKPTLFGDKPMPTQFMTHRLQALLMTNHLSTLNFTKKDIRKKKPVNRTNSKSNLLRKDNLNRTMRCDRRYHMKSRNNTNKASDVPLSVHLQRIREIKTIPLIPPMIQRIERPGIKAKVAEVAQFFLGDLMKVAKTNAKDAEEPQKLKPLKAKSAKFFRKMTIYTPKAVKPPKYVKPIKKTEPSVDLKAEETEEPEIKTFYSLTEMIRHKMVPVKKIKFDIKNDLINYSTIDRSNNIRHPEFILDSLLSLDILQPVKKPVPTFATKSVAKPVELSKRIAQCEASKIDLNIAPRRKIKKLIGV